jgi:hypothetical protein
MAILTGRMSSSVDVAVSGNQNETGLNTSRFKPSLPLGAIFSLIILRSLSSHALLARLKQT